MSSSQVEADFSFLEKVDNPFLTINVTFSWMRKPELHQALLHQSQIRPRNWFPTKDQRRATFLSKALNLFHLKPENVILVAGMNEGLFVSGVKVHPIPHYHCYEIQYFPWWTFFPLLPQAANEEVIVGNHAHLQWPTELIGQAFLLGSCLGPGLHNVQVGVSVTRLKRERHT